MFGVADYTIQSNDQVIGRTYNRRQNSLTIRYPCVCENCNTGWMSQSEQMVIPTLKPMISGNHPSRLSRHDQYALALWVTLRSMIFDAYSAKDSIEYFTQEERVSFAKSHDVPLNGSRMWIASMVKDWGGAQFSHQAAVTPDKNLGIKVTTCVIGQTALQMFHCKGDDPVTVFGDNITLDLNKLSTPAWQPIVAQIWPRRFVNRWPLQQLTEAGFYAFIDRFGLKFSHQL